jgi:hypothetical protein
MPSEVPINKFLGKTTGDNIMMVRLESPIVRQIARGDIGIASLVKLLTRMWSGDVERITFIERIEATSSYVAIKFPNPRKGRLVLSAELQRVLGFSTNPPIIGNARGEDPADEEFYDSLPDDTTFQVSFILDNRNDMEMPEPSEYSFQSLVDAYAAKFRCPSYSVYSYYTTKWTRRHLYGCRYFHTKSIYSWVLKPTVKFKEKIHSFCLVK